MPFLYLLKVAGPVILWNNVLVLYAAGPGPSRLVMLPLPLPLIENETVEKVFYGGEYYPGPGTSF